MDLATKFLEHFAYIASAAYEQGLWDDEDAFFYDVIRQADGVKVPLKVRSVVGLLPLAATSILSSVTLARLPEVAERLRWFLTKKPEYADALGSRRIRAGQQQRLLSVVGPEQLLRILSRMLDPEEFLSPQRHPDPVPGPPGASVHGDVGRQRLHRRLRAGRVLAPACSAATPTGAGRSGSRSTTSSSRACAGTAQFFGDDLLVEYPTGSGEKLSLGEIADDLTRRLVNLFLLDEDGRRPVHGANELFQRDERWRDLVPFYEYFHGDTGHGLGAAHQTGWTALVVDHIVTLHSRPR